jgi:DNA-binding response OmpR family regulator
MRLERDEFEVVTAQGGEEGLRKAYSTHPDAVVLDVTMPQLDGWAVCQRLRQVTDSPIIMLTGKSDTRDVVKGLSLGADDYMVKPCKLEELKARLRKVLRRAPQSTQDDIDTVYDDGYLRIDPVSGKVTRGGALVHLTPTESRLLNYLVSQRGRIVPHRELLVHVWGPQYEEDVKYLSVYIRYLRQKLEDEPSDPDYILTKYRVGYYFEGNNSGH